MDFRGWGRDLGKLEEENSDQNIFYENGLFSMKMKENTGSNLVDEERSRHNQGTMVRNLKTYTNNH